MMAKRKLTLKDLPSVLLSLKDRARQVRSELTVKLSLKKKIKNLFPICNRQTIIFFMGARKATN
jgi:hypothetical protein